MGAGTGRPRLGHEGEFAALPDRIRQLGPWAGSKEGDNGRLRPHYRALLAEQGFVVVHQGCGMAYGWVVRRLGAMVLAGFVWGVVLASAAQAQRADDPASAMVSEIGRLYAAGKYHEAGWLAQQVRAAFQEAHEKAQAPLHPGVANGLDKDDPRALDAEMGRLFAVGK
jgi:hypothetical protein